MPAAARFMDSSSSALLSLQDSGMEEVEATPTTAVSASAAQAQDSSSSALLSLQDSGMEEVEATPTTAVSASAAQAQLPPPGPPAKKKRMPDPEVIALSPETLLATNRFVCEICNKGFQREQNLQLHRRGHNLPWQRSGKEVRKRKRVYVCPEPSCVHHHPSRALADFTRIKKHFCRKHGEKKWECDKCDKKYAVQSDWKAHVKTCGSREYRGYY